MLAITLFCPDTEYCKTNQAFLYLSVICLVLQAQFKSCFVMANEEEKKLPTGVILPPVSQSRDGRAQEPIQMLPASAQKAQEASESESSKKKRKSRWD